MRRFAEGFDTSPKGLALSPVVRGRDELASARARLVEIARERGWTILSPEDRSDARPPLLLTGVLLGVVLWRVRDLHYLDLVGDSRELQNSAVYVMNLDDFAKPEQRAKAVAKIPRIVSSPVFLHFSDGRLLESLQGVAAEKKFRPR